MTATADALRELHTLHQRAKAIRDRLLSAPKTLAARQTALAARQADVEKARKTLQDSKLGLKKNEHALQASQAKIDDLKVKLNLVKKNEEYKALQNQIAHDTSAMGKYEDQVLHAYETIEAEGVEFSRFEAEVQGVADEVEKLRKTIEDQAVAQKAQLVELEAAIVAAEDSIPADQREQYRRVVRQLAADALAPVEAGACTGCYTSVTSQMVNELINRDTLTFCKSCGRLLYLADSEAESSRNPEKPKPRSRAKS
ncbi:zinc ribbon domain-containing protein [Planctomyces sp. SH-PL62]|uniref:zinc ribbon domain-containing protein n=1 Tax=Planctomyces sp. SH-PL62 TaxID=1636152 RepID=UPI00078EAB84|nr:C4-type zinc ribbon domain-containing protein [Planctomyces sp. SH-PL62]AMV36040.1 Putative zinc ribbon domain protein [Planctomyces sp. SH-PL62]